MANIAEIVEKLLQRSKEGKVKWSPTVREDTFLATVGNQTMTIAQQPGITGMHTGYVLRILNSNGFEVAKEESIPIVPRVVGSDDLEKLWMLARDTALHPEKDLDELLQALNSR